MAQMRPAIRAQHFGAAHEQTAIFGGGHAFGLRRFPETRPTAARIELGIGIEHRIAAARAAVVGGFQGTANLLAAQLGLGIAGCTPPQGPAFELLLALFDSTLTYRSYYQCRQELPALLDLLVCDANNPRAIRSVQAALRNELEALPKLPGAPALAEWLPSSAPGLDALCQRAPNQQLETLRCFLQHLDNASARLSDEIGLHYFNHNPSWHPDNPPARNSPC